MFELNIDTRIASVKRREKITAGSVGIQCRFAFSAEWDGLGKTAVFETDKHKIAVVLNTPAVTIPWEVCEEADLDVIVGVYGTNGNGTIVIPTIYAKLGTVAVGTTTGGAENAQTPTATDVQQITSAAANAVSTANTAKSTADEAKSIAQSVEQRANAGEFDGKDGAPLTVVDRVYHWPTESPGWETLIFSDGSELEVKSGKNGVDGQTPYIGSNGNWWIPGKPQTNTIVPSIDTGKPSRGENGRDGIDGAPGRDGADGAPGRDGADGAPGRDGIDGTSVTITNIAESAESGGTSVVTFSDGKTLHVRNGLDGQGGGGEKTTKASEITDIGVEGEYFESMTQADFNNDINSCVDDLYEQIDTLKRSLLPDYSSAAYFSVLTVNSEDGSKYIGWDNPADNNNLRNYIGRAIADAIGAIPNAEGVGF